MKLAEITLSVGMTEVEDADIQDARGGLKVQPVIIATPISDIAYNAATWFSNLDGATKNTIRNELESMKKGVVINGYRGSGEGTGTQVIPHSLGRKPTRMVINAGGGIYSSNGVWADGGGQRALYYDGSGWVAVGSAILASNSYQGNVTSVTSTDITISWIDLGALSTSWMALLE